MKILSRIRFRVYILSLYLLLLPIDATLGNILGSISIINYVMLFFFFIRLIMWIKEKISLDTLYQCKPAFIFFIYFVFTLAWPITQDLNSWYIFSLLSSFIMFLFSTLDSYSEIEYSFLKNSIMFSGIVAIVTVLSNIDLSSGSRLVLNVGRYMDPNYFSTGLVLITAVLIDNIFEKRKVKINITILVALLMTIILTGSRGGLLANIMVISVYIMFRKKIGFKSILLLFITVLSFLIVFIYFKDYIPVTILNRFNISNIIKDEGSGRLNIWFNNLSYYKDTSIFRTFFGNGFSTFSYTSYITYGVAQVAHSIYVQSLLEGGIFGLIVTVYLILSRMKYTYKERERHLFIFASLVGVAIGGSFLDIHVSRFFWNIMFFSTLKYNKI